MPDQTEWETKAANLLKAELKRKSVTYAQLVEKLDAIGITEIEVIGARIVEIDGLLHQPKPEDSAIKLRVAHRIAGNGGNVVNTLE